jgi:hypothetical protein
VGLGFFEPGLLACWYDRPCNPVAARPPVKGATDLGSNCASPQGLRAAGRPINVAAEPCPRVHCDMDPRHVRGVCCWLVNAPHQ